MRNWIIAGALALAMSGCKKAADNAARDYPATGAAPNSPGQRTTPSHEGDKAAGMQRQTAIGTPGGPTDDLGGRPDAGANDAGPSDAGAK